MTRSQMLLWSVPSLLNGSLTTSHSFTTPAKWLTSVSMCCLRIASSWSLLQVPDVSHDGNCWFQTRL